jgi:hypothetical protein
VTSNTGPARLKLCDVPGALPWSLPPPPPHTNLAVLPEAQHHIQQAVHTGGLDRRLVLSTGTYKTHRSSLRW